MAYTVKRGDTLWGLSQAYGVPLQELLYQVPEDVRKDPRKLMPGMQLNVPGAESPQAQRPQPRAQAYNREVPPLPRDDLQQTQSPSAWETLKREAPEEAMRWLQAWPPSSAARGLGSGLSYLYGTAARNKHPLEAIGAGVQDAYYGAKGQLGALYDKTRGFRDAVRGHPTASEQRMVDNMFQRPTTLPTAAKTVEDDYLVINPRQFAVRDYINRLQRGEQQLEPDMSRMSGNVSLGTLEKLYPRPSPAWQGAGPAYARDLERYINMERGITKPTSDPLSHSGRGGITSTPEKYYDFFIRNLNK